MTHGDKANAADQRGVASFYIHVFLVRKPHSKRTVGGSGITERELVGYFVEVGFGGDAMRGHGKAA